MCEWVDYIQQCCHLLSTQAKGKKPLFVQFVLENLWAVYDTVLVNRSVALVTNCSLI